MSKILVFFQSSEGKIAKSSLVALSAATQLKERWGKQGIFGACLGPGSRALAGEIASYGLEEVFFCEDPKLERYLAIPYSLCLHHICQERGCDTLVCAASSTGKDLAPRVSALLDAGQASDIIGVNSDGSLKRPMYAGNIFADVEITSAQRVVTVRSTAFPPAKSSGSSGKTSELSFSLVASNPVLLKAGEVVSYDKSASERPELGDAEIVVSGGRAMQSSENFQKYIFPLADALGAGVGASRAAVDSGYAPNDWQVGQTGKVVAPNLYIAVGISGAIQHLAGMKDSKTIVAINKDPDAPIFEVADYGLVADLFQAVPSLTDSIKKIKSA